MFTYPESYDVIVVGGGHAGIEAALASARMGCSTLLLTINPDTIGQMSCNPAIGGLAKGHLAREIDALGGEMGMATDLSGIQFRMLNTRKGPAVRAPRAQCDKKAYQLRMKSVCESQPNLAIKLANTVNIVHSEGVATAVETAIGTRFQGRRIIITTGTFLHGLMHIGKTQQPGGRSGEAASIGLSASLASLGLELGRLKTGTPPRLAGKTIDFTKTQRQPGDLPVPYFSFWKDELFHVEQCETNQFPRSSVLERIGRQLDCYITRTTASTAEIIRRNLHLSPLYGGIIKGIGPRYCPSIEDKIVRFADKEQHQIFLEPEGVATDEFYVNGFSTSLPFEVQIQMVRSIVGCENAEIIRPAYAVEYDFVFPTQLHPTLETKTCKHLYFAGQINGTSGYEEAAAQGLMAGINAVLSLRNEPPLVLRRDQAYIGVLIDDLVTKGTSEPYRMFTSRAEFRLLLRQDNADLRLSKIGKTIGLLSEARFSRVRAKQQQIDEELTRLANCRANGESLLQLLRRPEIGYRDLPGPKPIADAEIIEQIEIAVKYGGYIERQATEINRLKSLEHKQIPAEFDYASVPSLRTEARQKLSSIRPRTLGQASRISGVSPADLSILLVWLKRSAAAESSSVPADSQIAAASDLDN